MKTAVILLSRQPLRPTGQNLWVKKSYEAVQWLKKQNTILYTSVGMQTWELVLFLASINGIKQKIVIPLKDKNHIERYTDFLINQFNLNPGKSQFIPVHENSNTLLQSKRDRFILNSADVFIPVSIRKKGNFEFFLQNTSKSVIDKFRTGYTKKASFLKYSLDEYSLNTNPQFFNDNYLFHWTRSSNYCWPGEKLYDFYSSIISSKDYPKNAFNTLKNILYTKKIYGSSRHMPSKIKCVSFTGKSPHDFLDLMKWRKRYSEMSFEPYGIGLLKDIADKLGVKKVIYSEKTLNTLSSQRWLYQSEGTKGNWKQEEEYRFKGDFSFSDIPSKYMICVCRYLYEAVFIEKHFKIKTIHLFDTERL